MNAPIPQELPFDSENNHYFIIIKVSISKIEIQIRKTNLLPHIKYKKENTLQELQTISKWFLIFDSIDSIVNELLFLVKQKNILIKEVEGKLLLTFVLNQWNLGNITLEIPQCELIPLEVMLDICTSIKHINTTLSTLTESFEFLKENPEFMKVFNRGKYINNHQLNLISKDFLNLIKARISNKEIRFKLIYSTDIDERNSEEFHRYCDTQGMNLVVIKTLTNVFGGYTSQSWDMSEDYKRDSKAFLFSNDTKIIYPISNINRAIYCGKNYGPYFGTSDIACCSRFSSDKNSVWFYSYANGKKNELNQTEQFYILCMEVYKIVD